MTKQTYLNLIHDPTELLYLRYKETSKTDNHLDMETFITLINTLCLRQGKSTAQLLDFICGQIENELRIWRVYDKDKKFINFA